MAQVASELISITNNQKLADSKYIQDEALENKKQSDINKDSLAGGVYNVTKLRPLQSGYYTITTAIAAIPQALRRVGMVITYQTASDSWETKQFKGELSDWADSSKWEDFGGGEAGDGVYDISAAYPSESPFASLQAALTAFTDTTKKKGGMTIKFIQGTGADAKYVQYRLLKTTFPSTYNENDWEEANSGKIDSLVDEVNEDDDSPITSGGVYDYLNGKVNFVDNEGIANSPSNPIVASNTQFRSTYIPITNGDIIKWVHGQASGTILFGIFDSYKNFLSVVSKSSGQNEKTFTVNSEGAAFGIASFIREEGYSPSVAVNGKVVWKKKDIAGVVPTLTDYIDGKVPDIDAVPTKDSTNIVTSGGVSQALSEKIDKAHGVNLVDATKLDDAKVFQTENAIINTLSGYCITDYIPVNGQNISSNCFTTTNNYCSFAVYNESKNLIRGVKNTQLYEYVQGDYYVRFCFSYGSSKDITQCYANYGDTLLPYEKYTDMANISQLVEDIIDDEIGGLLDAEPKINTNTRLLSSLFNKTINSSRRDVGYIDYDGSILDSGWNRYRYWIDVSNLNNKTILFLMQLSYTSSRYLSTAFYECENIDDVGRSQYMSVGSNTTERFSTLTIPEGAKWLLIAGKEIAEYVGIGDIVVLQSDNILDYNPLLNNVVRNIICFGDSLTFGVGATTGNKYPDILQSLVGSKFNVINDGQSSATSYEIAARQGGIPWLVGADFTLPADNTEVDITLTNIYSANTHRANYVKNLECNIAGIPCKFNSTGAKVFRLENGNAKTIYANTPIILSMSSTYRKADINIYFIGTNGEYTSIDNYVEQIDRIVNFYGNPNYIIIGIVRYTNGVSDREACENALIKKYGSKFINWRRYLITSALGDAGITPTEEDEVEIALGNCPASLLSDYSTYKLHYNDAGYRLLANIVYERMKALGYLD